jgi:flavin reductase (DIM6/NTAB) family NADH-FMN oxidoreductase RutF
MAQATPAKPSRPIVDPQVALAAALRSCLGRFVTGVAVVTFEDPQERYGITVNSFTAVSMTPPLILVSIAKSARSHSVLAPGVPFCVNVLGAEQERVAVHFAGGSDKQLAIRWAQGSRAPRLPGALAHFECAPWRTYDGGDHTLFIGEIVDFDYRDGDALGFFASGFTAVLGTRSGHEDLF